MANTIYSAPPTSPSKVVLGRTLPSLLDDAVEQYPNPRAFNQPRPDGGWIRMSNGEFQSAADEIAAGLREMGVERSQHVAFFMESDMYFALCDFGTQIAGVVNVPLYTTFAEENLVYVTTHGEAKAIFISTPGMLEQFAGWADQVPDVTLAVLATGEPGDVDLPDGLTLVTLDDLRSVGRSKIEEMPNLPDEMRDEIEPHDLATLIYTSGTTGQPKGVMLTHENISSNVYAAFTGIAVLGHQDEVALTFLPLTHIYARMLSFANVAWGQQIFYSDPDHLVEHLPEVRPTMFATVPRVLEKVYDKVLLGLDEREGLQRSIMAWALDLAKEYDLEHPPKGLAALKHKAADTLVYSKLREKLGLTRIKVVSVGGAALRADLANAFSAFGVPTCQGYGLTETSPVISTATPHANKAGTVGPPVAGVEVMIAEDGEILTRGPHVMKGYFKQPDKTAEVLEDDGWFHTGDIGKVTPEGYLQITDRKKALFKLSTGKYVMPQPIENMLTKSPLIEQAVVMGNSEKYCTALVFPSAEAVRSWAKNHGVDVPEDDAAMFEHPAVLAEFEELVAKANRGMDTWSQVKRFRLVPELMTVENELLTPTMKVKRSDVSKQYQDDVQRMYSAEVSGRGRDEVVAVV